MARPLIDWPAEQITRGRIWLDAEKRLNREDESAARKARGTKPSVRQAEAFSKLKEAAARGDV
jgi:hypothetical protein